MTTKNETLTTDEQNMSTENETEIVEDDKKRELKNKIIKFKITQSEFEQLEKKAEKKGFKSIGVYARHLVFQKRSIKIDKDDLRVITRAFDDLKKTVESIEAEYKDEQEYIPIELEETNRKLDELLKLIMSLS